MTTKNLYHFTALEYLPPIKRKGLTQGELPWGPSFAQNVVWFTSDPDPSGHGLTDGEKLTEQDRMIMRTVMRRHCSENAYFPNKRAIRITVDVPNEWLTHWLPWAQRNLDPWWRDRMISTGGGRRKAAIWWFSRKPVPTEMFVRIEQADGRRGWIDITASRLAEVSAQ